MGSNNNKCKNNTFWYNQLHGRRAQSGTKCARQTTKALRPSRDRGADL